MPTDQTLTYKIEDFDVNQELSIFGMRYLGQADQFLFHQAIYHTGIKTYENSDVTQLEIPHDYDLADRTVQVLMRWGVDIKIMQKVRGFRGSITLKKALERVEAGKNG